MSQWFFSMQSDALLQSWVGKQNWLKANFSSIKANWNLNGKGNVRNVTKSVVKSREVGKTPIPHVDLLSYSFHLGRYVLTSHSEISCRHRFEAKFPYSFPLLEKFQFCSTLRWLDISINQNSQHAHNSRCCVLLLGWIYCKMICLARASQSH